MRCYPVRAGYKLWCYEVLLFFTEKPTLLKHAMTGPSVSMPRRWLVVVEQVGGDSRHGSCKIRDGRGHLETYTCQRTPLAGSPLPPLLQTQCALLLPALTNAGKRVRVCLYCVRAVCRGVWPFALWGISTCFPSVLLVRLAALDHAVALF